MQYFVDTNVITDFLTKNKGQLYLDAEKIWLLIAKHKIQAFTHSIVIYETVNTLINKYKIPKENVCQKLNCVLDFDNLEVLDLDKFYVRQALKNFGNKSSNFKVCLCKQICISKDLKKSPTSNRAII